jgi:hypothetical protein
MIKIDKDVPPPMAKALGVLLNQLKVGESFLIEESGVATRNLLSRKIREIKGKVFTSMVEEGGTRTWRLE